MHSEGPSLHGVDAPVGRHELGWKTSIDIATRRQILQAA